MEEEYEVVISGIGAKFPEADQIDELKVKLMNKESLVTINDRRWQPGLNGTPAASGKVLDVEKFDTTFFGIHRRLSNFMDPQNRHILERSFEAIYDAGYNPNSLKGGNIGVFISAAQNETEYILMTQKIRDGFGILGLSRAMLPNRISYFFNFKGPSTIIQNGWESGMEVLTIATKQIKKGRIDAALIGVPNLHMFSQVVLNSVVMNCLTFDDVTKSFDVDAKGYVQSEAVVMLFLQRKQDARRIYATVVHSDSCTYGARRTPFTHYNEPSIVSFLKDFYQNCKVNPSTIGFVEADGSAIKEKDLLELKALSQVIGQDKEGGLLVGSVKSNVGHSEAASCLVGIVKAIIAFESGIIPPNISFNRLHPEVPNKIKVVTDFTELNGDLVAVNGLSFTGGMGHALLQRNLKQKQVRKDDIPYLLLVSARNVEGAETVVNKISSAPVDNEFVSLVNEIHLFDIPGHMYRTFVVRPQDGSDPVTEYAEINTKQAPVWFVFSGMGSQWPGMGRDLLKLKVFADSVAKCHKVLAPKGIDIYRILTDDSPELFNNILNCFVGIACVQVALVDLLFAIGIKPNGIIGHSVGELGCAYADGCFTAEQMVLSAYARGRASVESELIYGAMAAVGVGYKDLVDKVPPGIEVACHNSSESCTISGPYDDIKIYVDKLTKDGIFARMVKSADIAYHSQYISPAGPKLLEYLKEVIPEPKLRSSKWISSSVPYDQWHTPLAQYSSPEYHTNNLLSSVLFEEASKHIPNNAICIEIAPHGLLQAIVKRSLKSCVHIPLTLRNVPSPVTFILTAIGKLYLNNLQPEVNSLYPKVEYPVSRGTMSLASLVTWDHSENWPYGEKNRTFHTPNEEKIDLDLQNKKFRELSGHKICDEITIPAFTLLYFVWEKLIKIHSKKFLETPVVFENIWVHEMLTLPQFSSVSLLVSVQQASGQFEVILFNQDKNGIKLLISGNCSLVSNDDDSENKTKPLQTSIPSVDSTYLEVSSSDIYDIFSNHGYAFTNNFKNIKGLYIGDQDIVGKIEWKGSWLAFLESLTQIAAYLEIDKRSEQNVYVPLRIQTLQINPTEFLHGSEKKEVSVCLNKVLNTIYCNGIKLAGLTFKSLSYNPSSMQLSIESPVFAPHGITNFKNVNSFLSASVQVAYTDISGTWLQHSNKSSLKVLLDENCQDQFLFKKELQQEVETITTADFKLLEGDRSNDIYLMISSVDSLNHSVNPFIYFTYRGFYLLQSTSPSFISNDAFNGFSIVFQQKFDAVYLTLLKMNEEKRIAFIQDTGLSKSDLLSHIKKIGATINDQNNVVALILKDISVISSDSIVQIVKDNYNSSEIKFIFIMDEIPFSHQEFLLKCENQLKKGLSVNYFKNGKWGSFVLVESASDDTAVVSLPLLTDYSGKEIDIDYISLNPNDFNYGSDLKINPSLGPIDFSGVLNKNERVMGLAMWNPEQIKSTLKLDNEYLWKIPDSWSSEDSVTIPLSYSIAYYSLKLLMKLKPYESILVHSGFSTLGHAVINVALQIGSSIYTTVNTETQKQELLSEFPELNDDKVLMLENSWFEDQVLTLTAGKGVSIIFCTLAGEPFNASLQCLATSGRFMLLNRADIELGHDLGMYVFLRNTSLYTFEMEHLFLAPYEWKKTINKSIKEGIENGHIKPLKKQIYQINSQYKEAIKATLNSDGEMKVVLKIHKENNKSINRHSNETKKSAIVVGSGTGLWLNILEFFAKRDIKNLNMVIDNQSISGSSSYKLNKLMSLYNVTIQTSSIFQLSSVQKAEEFIESIIQFYDVDSVSVMLQETDKKYIHNLDLACRKLIPSVKFICLIGAGEDICESRVNNGFHATAIVKSPQSNVSPQSVEPYLKLFYQQPSEHNLYVISQMSTANSSEDCETHVKLLKGFLPSSLYELEMLGLSLEDQYTFTEVNSLSPHSADLPFATPIFVIPGLTVDNIKPLTKQLMAPVFCANLPLNIESAVEAASHLAKSILEVQPKGPYNILGETWSGCIAVELSRLLEESGNVVTLILVSATPHTFQVLTDSLGPFDSLKFNKKILSLLLQLQSNEFDELIGGENQDLKWDDCLEKLLPFKLNEDNAENCEIIRDSLNSIRSRILSLINYKFCPLKQSSTVIIHPKKSLPLGSELNQLYGDNVTVHLLDDIEHENMLSSATVTDFINEIVNYVF